LVGAAVVIATGLVTGCSSTRLPRELVVFNQSGAPREIEIRLDGQVMYKGLLGTVVYAPSIVIDQTFWLERGAHTLCADVPMHSFSKCVPVTVGKQEATMIIWVNPDRADMEVHYGVIAFE
jgi:hypothetical protein